RWVDRTPSGDGLYWLEDVDLNGSRTLHGPVAAEMRGSGTAVAATRSAMVQDLNSESAVAPSVDVEMKTTTQSLARVRETIARPATQPTGGETSFKLAAAPEVKIFVAHEGWYRVSQPQLAAAGLSGHVNSRWLHLYAEGVEQPMRIVGGEQF